MKRILVIFVVTMISAALGLMWRLGVWKDVQVSLVERAEQHTIYADHLGAYHKMNDTIVQVENTLARNGFACAVTFGHYTDEPEMQDEDRLRSEGGCLVPSASLLEQINKARKDAPVADKPLELKAGVIPAGRYIHATFDGSPAISPWKIYPKMKELAREQRVRLAKDPYELYEIRGTHVYTTYLLKIL